MASSEGFAPPPGWEVIGGPAAKQSAAKTPTAKATPTPAPKPGYTREDVLQPPPGFSLATEPAEQVSTFGPLMRRLGPALAGLSDPAALGRLPQYERGYEKYVRDPAEHYVAGGAEAIHAPEALHALMGTAGIGDPKTYQATQAQFAHDFPSLYSPTAQGIAKTLVPGTLPAAAQDVAMLAMGPAEGALPVAERAVGMGLARGGAEKAFGTGSFGGGFLTGAGTQLAMDVPSATSSYIKGRRVTAGELRTLQNDVKNWGATIEKHLPFLKKGGFMGAPGDLPAQGIQNTEDIIREFVQGNASRKAGKLHEDAVNALQQAIGDDPITLQMKGPRAFLQGDPNYLASDTFPRTQTFQQHVQEINAIRDRGYTITGRPAGGEAGAADREEAYRLRDQLEQEVVKKGVPPKLLEDYSTARKHFDGVRQLEDLFQKSHASDRLIDQQRQIFKPDLQNYLQSNAKSLERAFGGPKETQEIINAVRQGAQAGKPVLSKPGTKQWGRIPMTPIPWRRTVGAQKFQPAGPAGAPVASEINKWVQKLSPLAGMAASNVMSNLETPEIFRPAHHSPGPGMEQIRRAQAEKIAPHGGAEQALKVSQDLRKGKTPDVQAHLDRGRLSHDELKQLLQMASTGTGDLAASTANVPIQDLISGAESGDYQERHWLMPVIMQRLRAELPKMQNKTMQAQLARRVQNLQLAIG